MPLSASSTALGDNDATLFDAAADNGGGPARAARIACADGAANPARFTLTFSGVGTQIITLAPGKSREIVALNRYGDGTLTLIRAKRETSGQASSADHDILWR